MNFQIEEFLKKYKKAVSKLECNVFLTHKKGKIRIKIDTKIFCPITLVIFDEYKLIYDNKHALQAGANHLLMSYENIGFIMEAADNRPYCFLSLREQLLCQK